MHQDKVAIYSLLLEFKDEIFKRAGTKFDQFAIHSFKYRGNNVWDVQYLVSDPNDQDLRFIYARVHKPLN